MKKIMFVLLALLTPVVLSAQKKNVNVKIKVLENYEEKGVKHTTLSSQMWIFDMDKPFRGDASQCLSAATNDSTTNYRIMFLYARIVGKKLGGFTVDPYDSDNALTEENLIVKLKNGEIIELPTVSSIKECHISYLHDNGAVVSYIATEEEMSKMCEIGVEKYRFTTTKCLVDLYCTDNSISEYLKQGVQMIKEAQSSYSKYKDL